jgi:hypothetical protein
MLPPRVERADEMRARLYRVPAVYRALFRRVSHEYPERELTRSRDDRRLPLSARDPRALEWELRELYLEFMLDRRTPEELRAIAVRALRISRNLEARCACHDADGCRLLPDELTRS